MTLDRESLQRWLDRYVEAWRSNDAEKIRPLFTEDATYRYHPLDEPVRGVEAITAGWLDDPDQPENWQAEYRALAVDGDLGFAEGWTKYRAEPDRGEPEKHYANLFVIRFADDGRCREFTEWYMQPRKSQS